APVSWVLASVWPGANHSLCQTAFPPGFEQQRPPRLHRDDPSVELTDRGPEPEEDVAEARASATLPHEPGFPSRLHIGREREHGLLRTRPARSLPASVREVASLSSPAGIVP